MITHVNQLEEFSSWRKFRRDMRKLKKAGASKEFIKQYAIRASRRSFLAFAWRMTEGKLIVEPFHELIGSAFEDLLAREYKRLIISCPPRSGKSFLSSLFLAWLIGHSDGSAQHILSSYGKDLSRKLFNDTYAVLRSKKYLETFPDWGGFLNTEKYKFNNKGMVLASSVGGPITGFTAGTLTLDSPGVGSFIVDDPLKGSNSLAALRELSTWWGEQASTRRTNNWCQLIIATRFSVNDLHGMVLKNDGVYDPVENPLGWRWLNIQALCENEAEDILGRRNGESHWESNPIFSRDLLHKQRTLMGFNAFSALYQGHPIANEGSLVKPCYVEFKDIEHRQCSFLWMSIDTAYSERETADDSVITVLGILDGKPSKVAILEMVAGKLAFPDLISTTLAIAKHYSINTICIENKASGISLIQMLKLQTRLDIVPMKADRSKSTRVQLTLPLFAENRVVFNNGAWNRELFDQLTQFPFHPHDDYVDSLVYGLLYFTSHLENRRTTIQDSSHPTEQPRQRYSVPNRSSRIGRNIWS